MTGGMDPRTPKSVRWVNGLVGDALGLEKWLGCVRFGLEVVEHSGQYCQAFRSTTNERYRP